MSFFVVVAGVSFGQPQPGRVIHLENADSLVGRVINGVAARELVGNVRFNQANVYVSCDRALQFIESGLLELTGNVEVRDDSIVIRAPRGRYHRDGRRAEGFDDVRLNDGKLFVRARYGEYFIEEKKASFATDVVVEDSLTILLADSVVYLRQEQRSLAWGNVCIHDLRDHISITGGRFDHSAVRKMSTMSGDPVLIQFDTSSSGRVDTLVVRSKVMESYQDSVRRLVAIDSVEIVRKGLSGKAGHALFFPGNDSLQLRKTPALWYDQSQITGDSIDIFLKNKKLDRVVVRGNAFAGSRSDSLSRTRFDQMHGEVLHMLFQDQELNRMAVERQATSIYYLYEEGIPNGLNRSSGDRLMVAFNEGKVGSINIYGGVEGRYVPENLVREREFEFVIPGFEWREGRPFLQSSDFKRWKMPATPSARTGQVSQ